MNKHNATMPSALVLIMAAILLPTLLLLSVPLNVMSANLLDLDISEQALWRAFALFAAAAIALSALFLIARRYRLGRLIAKAVEGISLFAFLWLIIGMLVKGYGGSIKWAALSEMLLAMVVLVVTVRVDFRRLCLPLAMLSAVQLLMALVLAVSLLHQFHQMKAPSIASATPTDSHAANKGNVYHIILDSFQDEVYTQLAAEKPELAFEGFHRYSPFLSHYSRTCWSIQSILTGQYCDVGMSFREWSGSRNKNNLWQELVDNGVKVHLYMYDGSRRFSNASTFKTALQCRYELNADPTMPLVDLAFLNAVPLTVRNYLNRHFFPERAHDRWEYGFSITKHCLKYFNRNATVNGEHLPYFSVQLFRQLMEDEKSRPDTGQYVFVDLLLPHPPDVFDANLNYLGPDSGKTDTLESTVAMHEASLRLMHQFVDELRELGRLDTATILINSDHGRWEILPEELNAYASPKAPRPGKRPDYDGDNRTPLSSLIAGRNSALLLARFAGVPNPPHSDAITQTIDIAPTVLKHFGLTNPAHIGTPLQEQAVDPNRPAVAFWPTPAWAEFPKVFSKFVVKDGRLEFQQDIAVK